MMIGAHGSQIPEEDLRRMHEKGKDSDHIDEVRVWDQQRVAAK